MGAVPTRRRRKVSWTVTIDNDIAQKTATVSERLNISRSALIERALFWLFQQLEPEEEIVAPEEAHFTVRTDDRPRHWQGRRARRAGEIGRKPRWMKEMEQTAETDGDASRLEDKRAGPVLQGPPACPPLSSEEAGPPMVEGYERSDPHDQCNTES